MTRAVLLPSTGDPFLLRAWLKCFERWEDEVDKLYICINNREMQSNELGYILDLVTFNPKIHHQEYFLTLDHGPAINKMLDVCQEGAIMLAEDDALIFKKGQVESCFKRIQDNEVDVIGSARVSCAKEIYERAEEVWGTPPQAPNFWPNFFFILKKNLLQTDRHFHAKQWVRGDYIKELDLEITDEISPADTFVWASIQLRDMNLRAEIVDQYHSRPEDIQDKEQVLGIFDRKCPWVHIGSMSGWQFTLMSATLQPRLGSISEWERRAAAWLMVWEDAQEDLPESMQKFSNLYKSGIDRLITEYTLSPARVRLRTDLFRYLINPELYMKRLEE